MENYLKNYAPWIIAFVVFFLFQFSGKESRKIIVNVLLKFLF